MNNGEIGVKKIGGDMNKQELLNEIKKAKLNINVLEDKVKALEEPKPKTGKVLRVEDLNYEQEIYNVTNNAEVEHQLYLNRGFLNNSIEMGMAFYDKQSAIDKRDAMLLAHECDVACAESWQGEEIDWDNNRKFKYCFGVVGDSELTVLSYLTTYRPFVFRKREHAQAFIGKHGEDKVRNMLLNY